MKTIFDAILVIKKELPCDLSSSLDIISMDSSDQRIEINPFFSMWKVKKKGKLKWIFERRLIGSAPPKSDWLNACLRIVEGGIKKSSPLWQAYSQYGEEVRFFIFDLNTNEIVRSSDFFYIPSNQGTE